MGTYTKQDCLTEIAIMKTDKAAVKTEIERFDIDVPYGTLLKDYPSYIDQINAVIIQPQKTISLTEPGTYTIIPEGSYNGLAGVTIKIDYTNTDWARWTGGGTATATIGGTEYTNLTSPIVRANYQGNMTAFSLNGNTSVTSVDYVDATYITSALNMFANCSSLTYVNIENTSALTSTEAMFAHCTAMTQAPYFDTSNVTNMKRMFAGAGPHDGSDRYITIPLYDTSKVTTMYSMFNGCRIYNIPQFDMSNVLLTIWMFQNSSVVILPELDTQRVQSFLQMFLNCTKLVSIGKINFSAVYGQSADALETVFQWAGQRLIHINVEGYINYTISFEECTRLSYESVKSILTAASLSTLNTYKTLTFNRTLRGLTSAQMTELQSLISICNTKWWTITGLTLEQ